MASKLLSVLSLRMLLNSSVCRRNSRSGGAICKCPMSRGLAPLECCEITLFALRSFMSAITVPLGFADAKVRGVHKGRKATIDPAKIKDIKAKGMGPSAIGKSLKIGRASFYRALAVISGDKVAAADDNPDGSGKRVN